MAPRKDLMRVLRQDAGYSARLGFGPVPKKGSEAPEAESVAKSEAVHVLAAAPSESNLDVAAAPDRTLDARPQSVPAQWQARESREGEEACADADAASRTSGTSIAPTSRGHVVYVSVSLTPRQAVLAETWAAAAKCSIPFLIRRVAQALRGDLFADWERDGMPFVDEARGARGKHPTSVTLTLRPEFAASLSARHDPLGIRGLARVIGPTFRARFETAFNDALAKAIPQPGSKGDVN